MNTVSSASDAARHERVARQSHLVAELAAVLPPHALLWHTEDTVPYECDGLTAYREQPLAVALPETEEQVAAVLRTCSRWWRAARARACRAAPCRTAWA